MHSDAALRRSVDSRDGPDAALNGREIEMERGSGEKKEENDVCVG